MAARRSIWTSTPLRLSFAIAGLFAVFSLATLAVTYEIVRDNTEQNLRAALAEDMAGYRALPNQAAVLAFVRSQSQGSSPDRRIVSYELPGGLHVGNAALLPEGEGYRAIALSAGVSRIEGDYFALGEIVRGGLLTIAVSAAPLNNIREAFLSVFLFSLVPTTLLVVGGGALLARRSARRLERIDATLDRLTTGDFAARVQHVGGTADDLSRIGERIDRMAAAQEQQIAALRQVSADIAHDLKTPIQRVSVLLQQLHALPGLDADAARLADRALAETDSIVRTFQALLQIAQIEGGSPKKRFETVDLVALARTFCEVYEPAAEDSGHKLRCVLPDAPARIRGDKTLLGQLFANLIENALRHTPAGCAIEVEIATRKDSVRLCVRDTGPGIPPEERSHVLRRLYRLERSRTTPGSGLGLSLVSAIAEIHDATLSLEDNAPGLSVVIGFRPAAAPALPPPDGSSPAALLPRA